MSEQSTDHDPLDPLRSVDLRTGLILAIVVAVGIVVAQFAQTLVQAVVLPVAEELIGHPRLDDAYLTIGSRQLYYGAALAAAINVACVLAIALVGFRLLGARHRRRSARA